MSDTLTDEQQSRYWLIARRRRVLLDELAALDEEMAELNRQENTA